MEFKYKLKESDYDAYLLEKKRQTLSKPLNRVFTVLLIAMPLIVLIYCLRLKAFSGMALVLVCLICIAFSIANLYLRVGFLRNSKTVLNALRLRNKLSPEFWKEHHLFLDDKGITLKCGTYEAEFSWTTFGGFKEINGMLIPIFNASEADMIPADFLSSKGGIDKVKDIFIDYAKKSIRANTDFTPPLNSDLTLNYTYSKDEYLRDQRDATRLKYLTKLPYNRAFFAKVALAVVSLYMIFTAKSIFQCIVFIVFFFVVIYEYIAIFSPILLRRLSTNLKSIVLLKPSHEATLIAAPGGLYVRGDIHSINIPYDDILAKKESKYALLLYLANGTMLTVPKTANTPGAAYEAFNKYLAQKIS